MEDTHSKSKRIREVHAEDQFPVMVLKSIGAVTNDPHGTHTPVEAAFLLIANYGDDGEFSFRHPMGHGTVRVAVEFEPYAEPTVEP